MTGKRDHLHILTGDAGIRSAKDVAEGLRLALEKHDRIRVDTQTLSAADITTIQSLIAARNSAEAQGKSLALLAPLGQPLRDALHATGLLSPAQGLRDFWTEPTLLNEDASA